MTVLVTGGAGFIGSNFVLDWIASEGTPVVNLDKLTYAGSLHNLTALRGDERHRFVRGDIADGELLRRLLDEHRPRAVLHFAAESHVDRSIHGPGDFIQTNVVGTFRLLEAVRGYWRGLDATQRGAFRFINVSTDEVYGSLAADAPAFGETAPCAPSSPYAASKAAADHLAHAVCHTYGLPVITTRSSNVYGPFQYPEKLIPLMILNAVDGRALPVYGRGLNVREWLYVGDLCRAIRRVVAAGRPGEIYNIGGGSERANLAVVGAICGLLDEVRPQSPVAPHAGLITFVADRPGHDLRYALDSSKMAGELGWSPAESFDSGLRRTVRWYLDNAEWLEAVTGGPYREWIELNYDAREGGGRRA